jgi:predicted NUDIX family NTP pyrophosphohydrolase
MPKQSAGLLMFRRTTGVIEVLLAHPGGPFWAKKDDGAWTIPKGDVEGGDLLAAAKREFVEETSLPLGEVFVELGEVRLKSGKRVHAWAFEGDPDLAQFASNTFALEWPPRSGNVQQFPEIDRVQFFALEDARRKLNAEQGELLSRLESCLR